MSKANYKFFTLLHLLPTAKGSEAAFNRVEVVSKLAELAKKN